MPPSAPLRPCRAPTDAELAALQARAERCRPSTARTLRQAARRTFAGTRAVSTDAAQAAILEFALDPDNTDPPPGAERIPT